MIGTVETKAQQLETGTFKTGTGKEVILIMGSCRSVPYLNYLNEWNKATNRFTIHYIDPFNWNWNAQGERVDYNDEIEKQEKNEYLLQVLSSVKVFIHEYYKNFGMFNTSDNGEKNIYDFGLNPEIDICVPNFHDHFILFNDIVNFDSVLKLRAKEDYDSSGSLSENTQNAILNVSQKNLERFYSVCRISDIPEMEDYFKENFTKIRLFWTSNHIAKHFSLAIFGFMNDKFLNLATTDKFWNDISKEDLYANNYVYLSEYDSKFYPYEWNEEIKPLKNIL